MKLPLRRPIDEVSSFCGIQTDIIVHFIEQEWVVPIDIELKMLDEEDVCRILLIHDLQEKFGVNDEGIPVILHLVDQLIFFINKSTGGIYANTRDKHGSATYS